MTVPRWSRAFGAACFLGGALGAWSGRLPALRVAVEWPEAEEEAYRPGASRHEGRELALVFIGGSNCRAAQEPALKDAVRRLKPLLRDRAAASGLSFAAVGASRDVDVEAGVEYLAGLGAFDEIVVGGGWLNSAIVRYVWQDIPGRAATPQVLVLERIVDTGGDRAGRVIADERLLVRKVGAAEIRRWVADGAPLPHGVAATPRP